MTNQGISENPKRMASTIDSDRSSQHTDQVEDHHESPRTIPARIVRSPNERPFSVSDVTIAWFSNTKPEYEAAVSMLQTVRGVYSAPGADSGTFTYCLGWICRRIVLVTSAHFWDDKTGGWLNTARTLRAHFPELRYTMVISTGIGLPGYGPLPHGYPDGNETFVDHDIRLGDVVVSWPQGHYGGVADVEDARGDKIIPHHVNGMSYDAKGLVAMIMLSLKGRHLGKGSESSHVSECLENKGITKSPQFDPLHSRRDKSGTGRHNRDSSRIKKLPPRRKPHIHEGTIASCLSMARINATDCTLIKRDVGAIAVQEGALLMMDYLAPIVVTGIAGYEDSHFDDELVKYAATTAAATAMSLVLFADID
jgi:hypothetical protein